MAFSLTRFLKGLNIREENTVTPKEIDIVPGGTSGTKTTITTSQTANRTITLPDATTTLTSTDSAQVLTNKTIDADLNTITNIDNNEIKAAAAIDTTKLADGSVTNTEFQYINSVTSNVQDQLDSKAPAATAVTLAGVQTLSNKTLDNTNTVTVKDTLLTIQDDVDTSKQARFQASAITAGTTRTLTIPDADTTLVGTATTQTLSNKTIGDTNTITVKDASFTVVDNVDTSKQMRFELSGLSGASTRTMTVPDTDLTIVGTGTAQTLTNKTISGSNNTITNVSLTTGVTGTLPIANGGTGQTTQTNAFDALSPTTTKGDLIVYDGTDNVRIAVGADDTVLTADSTQASGVKWAVTQAGIKNYILNAGAEANTNGWATYADAAQSTPVDGTGGSPTVTLTRSTSSPLRGVGSFLLTKDAANRQGQGTSYAFTIDSADQAKVLKISMDYAITSGTYSGGTATTDSDVVCYIYDVTNAQVIQPAGYKLDGSVSGQKYTLNATFQSNSNSTSYRLIFHVATTSASAYTVQFDNVYVTPQFVSTGAIVTDWQSFTASGNFNNGSYTGIQRRVGSTLEARVRYVATAQDSTGTRFRVNLPTGLSIDTNRLISGSPTDEIVGSGLYYDLSTTTSYHINVVYSSTTQVEARLINVAATYATQTATTSPDNTTPVAWAAGDTLELYFAVPITGWGTSQVLSSETDTRVVDFVGTNSSTQAVTADVTNITFTVTKDSHGAYSSGLYTVQIPGDYNAQLMSFDNSTSTARFDIYVNGSLVKFLFTSVTGNPTSGSTILPNLKAGDTISFRCHSSITLAAATHASISRIAGPSQVAATETVSARYGGSTTAVGTSSSTIAAPTRAWDTHAAYNTSTGQFTVPVSGKYKVTGAYSSATNVSSTATNAGVALDVRKNGIQDALINNFQYQVTGVSLTPNGWGSATVNCVAGDILTVTIFRNANISAFSLDGATQDSYVIFERIGV